jgi:O-antigen ligase
MSVAIMGTSVNHVASVAYTLLVLAGFATLPHLRKHWQKLDKAEKWLLSGFALYAVSGFLPVMNVVDHNEYFKDLERYIRFLPIILSYFYIRKRRIDVIRYLLIGAVISGPFLCAIAVHASIVNPGVPAKGYYHHIIFGSLAVLNIGIMLALLLTVKLKNSYRIIIVVSILCALTAAILSQSRGVWLVLPLYVVITIYKSWRHSTRRLMFVLGLIIFSVLLFSLTPTKQVVDQRVETAVSEIKGYYDNGIYESSIGTRLAMWKIALEEWEKYPFVGIGSGDFDNVVMGLQKHGEYVGMEVHASTHNIYMQALVGTGIIGLVIFMMAVIVIPVILFMRAGNDLIKTSGLILILTLSIVGLTESWTLRLPVISVYLIYVIILSTAIAIERENREDLYL